MRKVPDCLYVTGLSSVLVAAMFMLQGNIGINLADEGYLWYGTIQTYLGEVPLLDFQSYDPGRYYWSAFWFKVFGDTSMLTLRIAVMLFLVMGLTCALLAVRRLTKSWWHLLVIGILLLLWIYPRHKIFDMSICMIAVYMVILLLENPKQLRYLCSGIVIGLAAFIGSNHGLYVSIAFAITCIYIFLKIDKEEFLKRIGMMGLGIIIGYSPRLLMFIFIPGLFENFINTLIWLLKMGSTNLPLPTPWPWRVDFAQLSTMDGIREVIIGIFFILMVIWPIFWIIYAFVAKKANLYIIAAAFVALPYAHVAFSRADLGHLAQSISPLLLGICFFALEYFKNNKKRLVIFLVGMLSISYLSIVRVQPLYQKLIAPSTEFVNYTITHNNLWIDVHSANFIQTVESIKSKHLKEGEKFFVAPHSPTLYPILNITSPIWDIYLLFPETEERQYEQIKEMQEKNVTLVLLGDIALDNREELRFRNTHPILWEYFNQYYEEILVGNLPSNYILLRYTEAE
ncbi:hypothetical protein [Metasolibacillus meyeri]|uniref:hypothetical protein n=1 Tax=Metasolibacillus meyeri TaxID=1071052 RepID=UPI000D3152BD|nr:hypothetical protein [Metasolibacillus meyeri]